MQIRYAPLPTGYADTQSAYQGRPNGPNDSLGELEPSLQRVDLFAEGTDPVLLQNVDGFLGLVHRDDDGLAGFPQASLPDALTMDGDTCTVWLYNSVKGREIYGYCHYLHQCPGHICQTLR